MMTRHSRWKAESGVKPGSPAIFEHENISMVFDIAISRDKLNVKNLESFEALARRLQLHEAVIAENPEAPSYEGARYFLGSRERRNCLHSGGREDGKQVTHKSVRRGGHFLSGRRDGCRDGRRERSVETTYAENHFCEFVKNPVSLSFRHRKAAAIATAIATE